MVGIMENKMWKQEQYLLKDHNVSYYQEKLSSYDFIRRDINLELEPYQSLLKQGYSVISLISDLSGCDHYRMIVLLNEKLTDGDYQNLMSLLESVEQLKWKEEILYNFTNGSYRDNYDYWNQTEEYHKRSISKLVELYAREKLNRLNENELEMFRQYRTFDLEYLLCHQKEIPLVDEIAGIMIITNQQKYTSNIRKLRHIRELISMEATIHPHYYLPDFAREYAITESAKDIIVCPRFGSVVAWIPGCEYLNGFQKQQLLLLRDELYEIDQKQKENGGKVLDFLGNVSGERRESLNNLKEFDEFVEQVKRFGLGYR